MGQRDVYRARVMRVGSSYVYRLRSSVFSRYKRVQTDMIPLVVIDIHNMGSRIRVEDVVGQRSRHAPVFILSSQQRYLLCFGIDRLCKEDARQQHFPCSNSLHETPCRSTFSFRNVALARSSAEPRQDPATSPISDLSLFQSPARHHMHFQQYRLRISLDAHLH